MGKISLPEKFDRIDAIRAHLVDGVEISDTQQQMLEKYKAAFTWMSKNKSPGEAIAKMEKHFDLSYPHSAKIVRETIKLYGDVNAYSKQGLKQLMYEKFLRLASRAEKNEDIASAERLMDKACKVMDLYNPRDEKASGTTNIFISFTDDPAALEEAEKQNTLDIEHDEG